jgi:hypothetical protein
MPSVAVKARKLAKRSALTPDQAKFLDRLHTATRLVATPHLSPGKVIELLMESYPDLTEPVARRWVKRAKEYIALGVPEDLNELRNDYIQKLDWFIKTCSQHLVKDKSEITIVREIGEGGSVDAGKPKSAKKKVQTDVFNPAVAQILFKAIREYGDVTGGRPKAGPSSVTINNTQNNVMMPGRLTSEMTNEQLLRQALGDEARLLPEPGAAREVPTGIPAEAREPAAADGDDSDGA